MIGFIAPVIEKKLPAGVNVIAGAIVVAPLARIIATVGGSGRDIYPVKNRRDNLHGNRPVTDRYGIPSWRTSCRKRRVIDLQTSS